MLRKNYGSVIIMTDAELYEEMKATDAELYEEMKALGYVGGWVDDKWSGGDISSIPRWWYDYDAPSPDDEVDQHVCVDKILPVS
jgi:hypothetical protein